MNQISICILCWLHPDSWCLNPSEFGKSFFTSPGRNRDQYGYNRDCGEFSERPGDFCRGPAYWICIWWNIGWLFEGMPQRNMKCMKCPQKIISREISHILGHPNVRHLGSKLCAPWFLQRSFHNGLLDVSWLCRNERVHLLRTTNPFVRPRILK